MGFNEEYIKTLRECGRHAEADRLEDDVYGLFDKPKPPVFEDYIEEGEKLKRDWFKCGFFTGKKIPRRRSGIIKEEPKYDNIGINPPPSRPRPGIPNKSLINKTIESFQMEALQVLISEYENLDPEDPDYNTKRKELIELIKAMKEDK